MKQSISITNLDDNSSIDKLTSAFQTNCKLDFKDAKAMPSEVYTSEAFLELEQEHLFRSQWQCVGRASTLSNVGDYLTYDLAGQPVVVVLNKKQEIRAYSNVCLHRMSVLLTGSGNVKSIVCPYHAWGYDLDGKLRGASQMDKQNEFCKSDYQLPSVRCEVWQGWVYVTLNDDIPAVSEQLSALEALISDYDMGDYIEAFNEEHVWDCNWKILAENYMESYHLPIVHKGTVGPHTKLDDVECPPGHEHFNYHWFTKEATLPLGNAHPDNQRLQGKWRQTSCLISIYPNHLITLTPGYFWYLVLQPNGTSKVQMRFGGGLSKDFMNDPKAADYINELKTMLVEVNIEDRVGVESVMRGVKSRLAVPGQLSHLERPIYDFANYISKHVTKK